MAKSSRSTETLVQAIRESLVEAQEEGHTFCITQWSEADADAGYLLHVDGRMVAMGEYQYGFSHIDELLSHDLTDEVKRYARSEAGCIAGSIEAVDLNDSSDPYDLRERLPYAFQADANMVEAAVKAGKLTVEGMFEFLAKGNERFVMEGNAGNLDIQITKDVTVARFKQTEDGSIARELDVVLKAGQTAKGFATSDSGYANINVEGGHVSLRDNEFEAPAPQPRRPHP